MKPKHSIIKRLNVLIICMVVASVFSISGIMEASLRTLQDMATTSLRDQTLSAAALNVKGQAEVSNQSIQTLTNVVESSARLAGHLYENPDSIIPVPVKTPDDYAGLDMEGKTEFYYSTFDGVSNNKPEVLREVEVLSGLKPTFEAVKNQCPQIEVLSVYTLSGVLIGYDQNVSYKIGTGGYDPEALGKEYYIIPKETGETYVTDAYIDTYGRGLVVTISTPFYANGQMMGIIAADALIGDIYDIVCSGDLAVDGGYKVLLGKGEDLLCVKNMTEETTVQDVFSEGTDEVIKAIESEDNKYIYTTINGEDVYVMFEKMDCDWNLVAVLPVAGILKGVNALEGTIFKSNILTAVVGVILLLIMVIIAYRFCMRLTSPLSKLTEKVGAISGDSLDYVSDIDTDDEISLLDNKFYSATLRMKEYAENIAKISAEKERISAELNVATQIQSDMLPKIFPPFPALPFFDLYASMDPAKEVGGDFYDFYRINDEHIGITIADVSGKGVPAALFMVISKTLLKDQALSSTEFKPSKILSKVNNLLCEGNESNLFCTCWLGIYNIKTNKMVCSSAGHEYPAIRKLDSKWELFKDPHGLALAAMEGVPYKDYELEICPGEAIFVYTDGVPEATDANDELYGTDRMIDALNKDSTHSPAKILETVRADVDAFVGDAPQFDDLTMLCLEIKNTEAV